MLLVTSRFKPARTLMARTLSAALSLLLLLAASSAAQQDATVLRGNTKKHAAPSTKMADLPPFNSKEYRFRVVFPDAPRVQLDPSSASFEASDPDDSYSVKVLVVTLDHDAALADLGTYLHELDQGMRLNGATLTNCLTGLVSNATAVRCDLSKPNSRGMMILVRRGGVAYFVSAEQDRGNSKDKQVAAAVRSFLLLPEQETYTFADQNFRAGFPTSPRLSTLGPNGDGVVVKAVAAHDRYMTMVAIDDLSESQVKADPAAVFPVVERSFEQTMASSHLQLTDCAPVEFVGGYAAHGCQYNDDRATGSLLLILREKKIYSVLANQPRGNGSDAEIDAFIRSFQFLK